MFRYAMTYLNDAQVLQGLKLAGAVGFSQGGGVAALLEHGMAKCILQNRARNNVYKTTRRGCFSPRVCKECDIPARATQSNLVLVHLEDMNP